MWPPPQQASPPPRRRAPKPPPRAARRCAAVEAGQRSAAAPARHRSSRWRSSAVALRRPRPGRAAGVPAAPHRVRARLLRRLAGGLERHAGAAHAADERHQRHQRHHRRSAACCRSAGRSTSPVADARRARPSCSPRSTSPAASWSPSACCGCSASRSRAMPETPRHRRLPRRRAAVHPQPRRPVGAGDRAARQPLRHRRHAARGASPRALGAAGVDELSRCCVGALARRRRASAPCWPRASR